MWCQCGFIFLGVVTHVEQSFENLRNSLGHYLVEDFSFKETKKTKDITVARVLVSLELREKLHETMNIGKRTAISQVLDYEGILFRCKRCQKYGHLVNNCSLPFKNPLFLWKPSRNKRL